MATVSLDRLVLLMRVLGPHQMCFVQQTTLCNLQHRWQRGCQGAQRLQVVRTRRRSVFAFTGDSAACSTDENQGAHRLQVVECVYCLYYGEQERCSPPLHMWAKHVVTRRVMRQSDIHLRQGPICNPSTGTSIIVDTCRIIKSKCIPKTLIIIFLN